MAAGQVHDDVHDAGKRADRLVHDDPRPPPAAHQRQLAGLEADGSRHILRRVVAADQEGDTRRIASPAARGLRRRGRGATADGAIAAPPSSSSNS